MTQVTVRRAVPADAIVIHAVVERAIRGSAAGAYPPGAVDAWARGGSSESVHRMIETTDGFVAVVDGAVVGWADLDGQEVDQLHVDPDTGGRGVARRLYEAVEQSARARGLRELTAVASLRAAPAFDRFGFRRVARTERSFNGCTFTVVQMTMRLDGATPR